MNRAILAAVAIAWCGVVASQAPSVIDFRGFPLGASEADFKAANPAFSCVPTPIAVRPVADSSIGIVGHVASETSVTLVRNTHLVRTL